MTESDSKVAEPVGNEDDWDYMSFGHLIVINGHVSVDEARDVVAHYLSRPPFLDVESISRRVWARPITSCPTHTDPYDDECEECDIYLALTELDEWWDWPGPDGDPDANINAEGYVPLTVVSLG